MITFRNIVGYFNTIATNHKQLQSFHSGFLDDVDINKLDAVDFPILYAEPGSSEIGQGYITYSFTIYVLDQLQQDMDDRNDVLTENLLIIQDVINEFKQNLATQPSGDDAGKLYSYVNTELVLEVPITAEPFTARFDNILTGWNATLSIQANNTNNLCNVPIPSSNLDPNTNE